MIPGYVMHSRCCCFKLVSDVLDLARRREFKVAMHVLLRDSRLSHKSRQLRVDLGLSCKLAPKLKNFTIGLFLKISLLLRNSISVVLLPRLSNCPFDKQRCALRDLILVAQYQF